MWWQAVAQLVQQEAATPNIAVANPYAQSDNSTLWVVGGVAVLAVGAAWFALRSNR